MTVDADEWIQTWCIRSRREEKKVLDYSGYSYSKLTGRLDLYHFVNLEEIIIFNNKLEVIEIGRLSKLRKIDLHNNNLTSLDVSHNLALEKLDVRGNKIVANLSIFSHLVNLKELKLGVVAGGENKTSFVNDFSGSLGSLGKLENLEHLDISQQVNIEPGCLELFPANKLKYFVCQGTVFEEQLRPLNFNVRAWQIDNDLKIHQDAMKAMDAHYREKIVVDLNNKIQHLENEKQVLADKLIKNAETIQKALEELGNNISNQDYFFAQNLSNLNQVIIDCQEVASGRCRQLESELLDTQNKLQEEQRKNADLEEELKRWDEEEIEERTEEKDTQTDEWKPTVETKSEWKSVVSGDTLTPGPSFLQVIGFMIITIVVAGFWLWVAILIYEKVKTWFKTKKNDKKEN